MPDRTSSFEALVMPYLSDALALARWLTHNRADAEDVVQEACLRACRSIGPHGGGRARVRLLTIVRNTAHAWLERNRTEALGRLDLSRHAGGGDFSASGTPQTALLERADAAMLETAIRSLPVELREILVLRDIQGFDYREIAQITSVPVGTVMSRLSGARRHLLRSFDTTCDAAQPPTRQRSMVEVDHR